MNQKVLLADDSLTIQKVIKITLNNQPYDITDCSSEDELFQKLTTVEPKLVFLDFNLSEKYTGYELTSKIKSILPSTKVLLLLGTFDTVDDAAMEKCGASDKIVKPFDSNKFIAICKQLVEAGSTEEIAYPEEKKEIRDIFPLEKEEDQWTVNHSTEQKFVAPEEVKPEPILEALNPLDQEISDWGMSVPGIINETASHDKIIDLPPVIGEIKPLAERRAKAEEAKFPENDDLDYPTMEELTMSAAAPKKEEPSAKLISIETFNDTGLDFQIEHGINTVEETDVKSIEAQIRDEVEENLWQVDEFEDLKKELSQKMEEAKNTFQPSINDFDESLFAPLDEKESIDWNDVKEDMKESTSYSQNFSSIDADQIMNQIRSEVDDMIKKHVQEYMDQMFKKNVEKISWEVIPDLAENLIRQELTKISNKIISGQN